MESVELRLRILKKELKESLISSTKTFDHEKGTLISKPKLLKRKFIGRVINNSVVDDELDENGQLIDLQNASVSSNLIPRIHFNSDTLAKEKDENKVENKPINDPLKTMSSAQANLRDKFKRKTQEVLINSNGNTNSYKLNLNKDFSDFDPNNLSSIQKVKKLTADKIEPLDDETLKIIMDNWYKVIPKEWTKRYKVNLSNKVYLRLRAMITYRYNYECNSDLVKLSIAMKNYLKLVERNTKLLGSTKKIELYKLLASDSLFDRCNKGSSTFFNENINPKYKFNKDERVRKELKTAIEHILKIVVNTFYSGKESIVKNQSKYLDFEINRFAISTIDFYKKHKVKYGNVPDKYSFLIIDYFKWLEYELKKREWNFVLKRGLSEEEFENYKLDIKNTYGDEVFKPREVELKTIFTEK